jgi:hypothetical protein
MWKIVIVIGTTLLCAAPANAENYPLGGKWAYDNSTGSGPIDCSKHSTIEFSGNRRFETGGRAPPDYRNVSVEHESDDSYRIVDRFFNGMQDGKVAYTLRRIDPDHIEIKHEMGGATATLRACH